MLDFGFFRSPTFLGASLVAFTVTFGMLASFFFITLYMQNILGYGPLEAGVRSLPTTILVMAIGPVAGRLTDRIGPRIPLVTGLLLDGDRAVLAVADRGGHVLRLPRRARSSCSAWGSASSCRR